MQIWAEQRWNSWQNIRMKISPKQSEAKNPMISYWQTFAEVLSAVCPSSMSFLRNYLPEIIPLRGVENIPLKIMKDKSFVLNL